MKNFIVAGVSCAGKSLLSKRLSQSLGLSRIPIDALVSTFGGIFPEHGIRHVGLPHPEIAHNLRPFLVEFMQQLDTEGLRYVLDCYYLLPEDVAKFVDLGRYRVVFLGYPDADPEAKLREIRRHSNAAEWTAGISDREMLANVKEWVSQSKFMHKMCGSYGLDFIDTGHDFEAALNAGLESLLAG